jgi:hypothetical protein
MSSFPNSSTRRYRRVSGVFPIILFSQGETYRLKATNLSEGGLFIAAKLPMQIGALVHLRLGGLPDKTSIQAVGQVRFAHPGIGIGIRFSEISDEDVQRISAFVSSCQNETQTQTVTFPPRDARLRLALKLKVSGRDQNGEPFEEEVYTEDVSRRGVGIVINHPVGVGDVIRLTGLDGQFNVEAVVRYACARDGQWRVGIHFLTTPKRWVVVGMAVSALSQWEVRPAATK